jgi:hypothetical protein
VLLEASTSEASALPRGEADSSGNAELRVLLLAASSEQRRRSRARGEADARAKVSSDAVEAEPVVRQTRELRYRATP